jgi:hypothetical protein
MKYCFIAVSACLVFSCIKSPSTSISFPSATQSGKNTFGCYIDGVPFIPYSTLYGNVIPISVTYYYDSTAFDYDQTPPGYFSIEGIDVLAPQKMNGDFSIQKVGLFTTGQYPISGPLNCPNPLQCDAGGYENSPTEDYYFIDSGMLNITRLDTLNKIISGTFNFTVRDSSGNTKQITGGVFDVTYPLH